MGFWKFLPGGDYNNADTEGYNVVTRGFGFMYVLSVVVKEWNSLTNMFNP